MFVSGGERRKDSEFVIRFMIVLSLAFIPGCTIATSCILFNNTSYDASVAIESLGMERRTISLKASTYIEVENWPASRLKVSTPLGVWTYATVDPAEEFVRFSGFGPWAKRTFKAQLETDGRVFVVEHDQPFPQIDLPQQPQGYPLVPKLPGDARLSDVPGITFG
jgi:hypothetical protein